MRNLAEKNKILNGCQTDSLSDTLDKLDVKPEIDMFACRLNHHFPRYVSYKPDPDAEAVNAFTM